MGGGELLCAFLYLELQKIEGALAAFGPTSPALGSAGSLGREFMQSLVRLTYLCSIMSPASAGKIQVMNLP